MKIQSLLTWCGHLDQSWHYQASNLYKWSIENVNFLTLLKLQNHKTQLLAFLKVLYYFIVCRTNLAQAHIQIRNTSCLEFEMFGVIWRFLFSFEVFLGLIFLVWHVRFVWGSQSFIFLFSLMLLTSRCELSDRLGQTYLCLSSHLFLYTQILSFLFGVQQS